MFAGENSAQLDCPPTEPEKLGSYLKAIASRKGTCKDIFKVYVWVNMICLIT